MGYSILVGVFLWVQRKLVTNSTYKLHGHMIRARVGFQYVYFFEFKRNSWQIAHMKYLICWLVIDTEVKPIKWWQYFNLFLIQVNGHSPRGVLATYLLLKSLLNMIDMLCFFYEDNWLCSEWKKNSQEKTYIAECNTKVLPLVCRESMII